MSDVSAYYNTMAQREWERLERHRTEFAVTLRACAEYLPAPPATIFDIGGGPGRYAIVLTKQGYSVTLIDLSVQCVDLARVQAQAAGVQLAGCMQGDATSLVQLQAASCDAVLLLGPLYHLVTLEDRQRAVREAYRLLKPGGVILAAFITRYTPVRHLAKHNPLRLVERYKQVQVLLDQGVDLPPAGDSFTHAYFAHPYEIRPLLEHNGFTTLDMIGCEGVVSLIEDQLNELGGAAWETWIDLNYRLGKDPSVHGAAEHVLYVGCKY